MPQFKYLILPIFIISLIFVHLSFTTQFNLPLLLGDRSVAILDLWSFQHFFSGILLGSLLLYWARFKQLNTKDFLISVFLLALLWEFSELLMEAGWFGQAIATWKGSFEHWGNRFVGDLLMVTTGGYLAWRFRSAWKLVLIPAAVWLIINVISPTSMSVQNTVISFFS